MAEIKLTIEKSEHQAMLIQMMNIYLLELDADYLAEGLKKMHENHGRRDALAVLCPNPLTYGPMQEVSDAKNKQLELIIKLARNVQFIRDADAKLGKAKAATDQFSKIFQV